MTRATSTRPLWPASSLPSPTPTVMAGKSLVTNEQHVRTRSTVDAISMAEYEPLLKECSSLIAFLFFFSPPVAFLFVQWFCGLEWNHQIQNSASRRFRWAILCGLWGYGKGSTGSIGGTLHSGSKNIVSLQNCKRGALDSWMQILPFYVSIWHCLIV
jgi:hypothetical protein